MGSFYTQRLANYFPVWTAIRRQPSSVGQRLLSPFAEVLEQTHISNKRMADELQVLKWRTGLAALYHLTLSDADQIGVASGPGGGKIYTYPASVTANTGAFTLSRVDTLEELLNAAPDRVSAISTTTSVGDGSVWSSSAPGTYTDPTIAERLWIHVDNSTTYERNSRTGDRLFDGNSGIKLTGTDLNDKIFIEYIVVEDDGIFMTRNVFKTLTNVEAQGFDGDIEISSYPNSLPFVNDPYRVAVFDDMEGPLKISIRDENISATDYGFVTYATERLKKGSEYRRGQDVLENTETLSEQLLLDGAGSPVVPVSCAISPEDGRLYVANATGTIYVYDHGPSTFEIPNDVLPPEDTCIEPQPLRPYVSFGKTEKVFTWLHRPRSPIQKVEIKRRNPVGLVHYLQGDLTTWSGTPFDHFKTPLAANAEDSWDDLTFSTEYDVAGQWEYYITTTTKLGSSTSYAAVYVDSMRAVSEFSSGMFAIGEIFFDSTGNLSCVDTGGSVTVQRKQLHSDAYVADATRQILFLRESYSEVSVGDSYTTFPEFQLPNGLDEVGLKYDLPRMTQESLSDYRRRLLLEIRDPSGASEEDFIRTTSRKVGEFDTPVFTIGLQLDGSGDPLAADPYVEVTSTRLRAYDDYANESLEFEIDFTDRSNGYFLADVNTAFAGSSFFTITVIDSDYTHKRSDKLAFGNTNKTTYISQLPNRYANDMGVRFVSDFYPQATAVFLNEVGDVASVVADGDFHIDYNEGTVWSHTLQTGYVMLSYRDFPYTLNYQVVRSVPFGDDDLKYVAYDALKNHDTGADDFVNLNSKGAKLFNDVLKVHPLSWGK